MEPNQPETASVSGQLVAPQNAPAEAKTAPERMLFTATAREKFAAFLMYVLAYVYIDKLLFIPYFGPHTPIWVAAFVIMFVALTEYLHRDTPRPRESWVWLGCLLTVAAAIAFGRCHAWREEGAAAWDVVFSKAPLFLHIFAVWWALSRSNALLDGESGHLLPLDALDGFIVFPFKHFFLRLRTVGFTLSHLRGGEKREKPKAGTVGWSLVISAAALGLLWWAVNLLVSADDGFADLVSAFLNSLRFEWYINDQFLFRFLLSLPVGAYLFGLLAGTLREDKDALRKRAAGVGETLEMLRGVPERVWLVLLILFCAVYALFFAVQARYLFGAFTGAPPEGFSVAEYARQGFFELCKVMAVNFALLWLATRSSKVDVRQQKAARALCLALLAESFLLAVVAFSKLALYIDIYGFTPKRLQSTWLVCVLAFGCGCAAWSLTPHIPAGSAERSSSGARLAKGGKPFRMWMYFGAATLALLCLY